MKEKAPECVVCEGDMIKSDIPKYNIYVCADCRQVGQLVDGAVVPISSLLERHALGDDRVKAAISKPHVSTVQSFIDIFENTTRFLQMDLASASGGLRTILHMLENRIDSALSCFSGLDLASDNAAKGLSALREARELVSIVPQGRRQPQGGEDVDDETPTPK